jgi:hypothetical protein
LADLTATAESKQAELTKLKESSDAIIAEVQKLTNIYNTAMKTGCPLNYTMSTANKCVFIGDVCPFGSCQRKMVDGVNVCGKYKVAQGTALASKCNLDPGITINPSLGLVQIPNSGEMLFNFPNIYTSKYPNNSININTYLRTLQDTKMVEDAKDYRDPNINANYWLMQYGDNTIFPDDTFIQKLHGSDTGKLIKFVNSKQLSTIPQAERDF